MWWVFVFVVQQEGLEGEITRRSLTHTAWDLTANKQWERRGWHPLTYKYSDATPKLIQSIKVFYYQKARDCFHFSIAEWYSLLFRRR